MKFGLVLAAGLFLACAAQGQNAHQMISNGGSAGGGFGGGFGGGSINSAGGHPIAYEEPHSFAVGYATNDGPYVPSTYVNYGDALALGKQVLAEEEEAKAGRGPRSAAGAARLYGAAKGPTSKPRFRVSQDDAGKLQICDSNGRGCHPVKSRALVF